MILVTGGNGFIGRHIVRRLAQRGPVRAMVRDRARAAQADNTDLVEADLTRPDTLPAALAGATTVIHAAAVTGNIKERYRGEYDAANPVGTENLVAAARAAGVQRLVLVSGLGTKPDRPGTYMAGRWAMEEAARGSGIDFAVVRASVLFGDGAPFVAELAKLARVTPVVPAIGGNRRFQPIWVEDLVSCLVMAADEDRYTGSLHTVGGPEHLTFGEIIKVIGKAIGRRRTTVPLPMPIARVQAAIMTALLPHPPLTPAMLELFSFDNITDVDAVQRDFGFEPRAFADHVARHGLDS